MISKLLWQFLFKITGWTIEGNFPDGVKKGIIVVAPHTSNWDFPKGIGSRAIQKFPTYFMIKDSWTKMPIIGWAIKAMGGVGVDRSENNKLSMSEQIIQNFKTREEFVITIAPEGTRSYNPKWKTGFWHIAKKADVPLILASFDYPTKRVVWGGIFETTDDKDHDIQLLKEYFKQFTGLIPEQGVV